MPFDRFIIAPLNNTGLQNDVRPWLIPDEAYAEFENAYAWRGRARKRWGTRYMNEVDYTQYRSRLRVALTGGAGVGITSGAGAAAGTVPGGALSYFAGQMFTIGSQVYTVPAAGTPVNMLTTGAGTGTYDTATGAYVFAGAPINTQIYWYPALPVTGLLTYETTTRPTYAFDTRFAYQYTGGAWERLGTAVWTGSFFNYVYGTTYRGIQNYNKYLFVVNNIQADGIKYYDGTNWVTLAPPVLNTAGNVLYTARIVVSFQNRLIFMNTLENTASGVQRFTNRARYSGLQDPTAVNAFNVDVTGNGSFIDNMDTQESITAVAFLKDRLIVFFDRTTYELVYTGSQGGSPFRWQLLSDQRGAESTFSAISLDNEVYAIGNSSIVTCTGANVNRLDGKIPNEVWNIHNGQPGPELVYGINDMFLECVYWTYPDAEDILSLFVAYNTKILLYNYRNRSWAIFRDTFTVFGHFIDPTASYLPSGSDVVLAGNQQGYVLVVNPDEPRNAGALQISNIVIGNPTQLIVYNHNYVSGEYVLIENAQGITSLNNNIYLVTVVSSEIIEIDATTVGVYTGGGTIARVSNYNITSKEFNPYVSKGRNVFLQKIDYQIDNTDTGEVIVDYFVSTNTQSQVLSATATNTIMGTNILNTGPYALYPFENSATRLWHPVYFQGDGEFVQFKISMNDTQMRNPLISLVDFQLHGFVLHTKPTSSRLQ